MTDLHTMIDLDHVDELLLVRSHHRQGCDVAVEEDNDQSDDNVRD